jgi:hypothetical protein
MAVSNAALLATVVSFIAQSPIGFPSRKEHPINEHRPKEVALFPAVRAEFVEKGCGPAAQYCFSA